MPVDKPELDAVSEADLMELVQFGVPEGLKYEYKSAVYGNSDAEKKEALKDISSFANTAGGHLIIGVQERQGIAQSIDGVSGVDPEAQKLRLEQLMQSGLEPRIFGVKVGAVPLKNGNHVFVIRIPKSWNPPHRVILKNTNRFFLRNSSGVHEASVEELRQLFTMSENLHERIRTFRDIRIKKIARGQGPMKLEGGEGGGRIYLHIVPLAAFEGTYKVDLSIVHEKHQMFRPMGATAFTPRFNFDGHLNFRGGEPTYGYTQIFRNGVVEATKAGLIREHHGFRFIPGAKLHDHLIDAIPSYLDGLRAVGVPTPAVIMITLEGVKGVCLAVKEDDTFEDQTIDRSVLPLPEVEVIEYGTREDYQRLLRPAFDALWNAVGYIKSLYFDDDDLYVRSRSG